MFHFLDSNTELLPVHHQPRWGLTHTTAPLLAVFCSATLSLAPSLAQELRAEPPTQQARTPSPFVGSAMAVLATLEEANVLPPEGTSEANQIIKSVIQLQSTFIKSSDPAIQQFMHGTMQRKYREGTEALLERFRSAGWTAEVLEALSDRKAPLSGEERHALTEGLRPFNLSIDDLTRFLHLVQDGQLALAARGKTLTDAYTAHREQMPGRQTTIP